MELVVEKQASSFDLSGIGCGYLLWGRHSSWEEGKAGIVTSATESQLTVQYHPGIGNVINHFIIPVSEAAEGQWEIRWSKDMSEVFEYGMKQDPEEPEDGETEPDGTEEPDLAEQEPKNPEPQEPEIGTEGSKPEHAGLEDTENQEGSEEGDGTGGSDTQEIP